jgi:hypothetical protein
MEDLHVTDQDLIVLNGGGKFADTGHRSHFPIWKDKNGDEFIYIDGQRPIEIGQTGLIGQRVIVTR